MKCKSRFLKATLILAILAILLLPSDIVKAEEGQKVVRVGCMDIDKFLVMEENGNVSGYGAEYLKEISRYTGWKYEYVKGSWKECLEKLEAGEIDLLFPAQYSEDRAKKYIFSQIEGCISEVELLTYNGNQDLYYGNHKGFDSIHVGLLEESYLNHVFDNFAKEMGFSYVPVYYEDYREMCDDLNTRKLDAIVSGNIEVEENQKILARFGYIPEYFIANNDRVELMKELNDAVYQIKSEDPFFQAELFQKYFGSLGDETNEFTDKEEAYIRNHQSVRVVCDNNNYPFEWYDSSEGVYKGINIDILNTIARNNGMTMEYIYTEDFQESWESIKKGEADIICGVFIDGYLEDLYQITGSDSYMSKEYLAIGRLNHAIYPNEKLTVIIRKSSIGLQEYIRIAYPKWEIITADDMNECYTAVGKGEADITLVSLQVLQTEPVLAKYTDLTAMSNISLEMPMQMGVSNNTSPLLVSIMNKSILMLNEDDLQAAIVNNTLARGPGFSIQNLIHYYPVATVVGILILCMIIAVLIIFIYHMQMKTKQAIILEESNRQLCFANVAKTDFLSRMSHDIRTPMNGIIGLTRLVLDKELPEDVRDDIEKVDASAHFLLGLVNDILDMTKVEEGEIELNPQPYPFHKLVKYMNSIILPQCIKKKITFIIKSRGMEHIVLIVDELRINQIVFNLLSNAVKFTPEGGRIETGVENVVREKETITMDYIVRDSGIGMSGEFQEHMFEPFTRENRELINSTEGTGLGLAIVNRLTDLLEGTIVVTTGEGEGTEFRIHLTLPYTIEEEEEESEIVCREDMLTGKRVLICEDHPLNREIVERLLKRAGMETAFAEHGKAGLELFEKSKPGYFDLILMDIRMPVMDGLEAARAIRSMSREDAAIIPIVAMTANAYKEDREKSKAAGMNEHLSKPVEPEELCRILCKQLAKEDGHVYNL